jgi:large subunit ribosomal protein L25
MSVSFEIEAEFRTDEGKGASRRLRRAGRVPAVIYGGHQEPRSLSLDHDALLHNLENEAFYSHILTIKVGDLKQAAILKDLQRHPAKRQIIHVDFQRVTANEAIRTSVPLHFEGEEKSPGRRAGGVFNHTANEIEISCLPGDLPEYIAVDVSKLDIDDNLHLSDIALPKGVESLDLAHDNDMAIVTVSLPRAAKAEDDEAPEAGEADEGEGDGEAR